MRIELELVGKGRRWEFDKPRVVLGREPHCDVALQSAEFPSVSREHVALSAREGALIAEDLHSSNGTLLNGAPLRAPQPLRPGDVLRLGPDGPQLRVQFAAAKAAAVDAATMLEKPARGADDATRLEPVGRGEAATRMAQPAERPAPGDAATRLAAPAERSAPGSDAATRMASAHDVAQGPPSRKFGAVPSKPATTAAPPAPPVSHTTPQPAISGDEAMLEQKIGSVRTLAVLMLIVLVVMLGIIIYQSQQIDKNRQEIQQLRADAQNSLATYTPQLQQRLDHMQAQVDGMDGKMQAAEDHMVARLNDELPRMLDKYVDRKMKQMETDPKYRDYGVK